MSFLKEKYEDLKTNTIGKFFGQFQSNVSVYNAGSGHFNQQPLKDAITDLSIDEHSISFKFLHYKIVLNYKINLKEDIIISAYQEGISLSDYPKRVLTPIASLDFSISMARNGSGFHNYIFNSNEYCIGNKNAEFFTDYTKMLKETFFPS